jgi:MFS family permease
MRERYLVLVFCSVIWFLHNFVANSLSVLLPLVTTEFSLSYYETGVLVTASLLVFALMQFPTGHLAGRIGSKRIVVFGMAFHSIFSVLTAVSSDYAQFFALNMLRSVGTGCHLTVATAFVSNHFEASDRGKAIGTHESAVSLGGLVAPIVTLPLALLFSWRFTYLVYGVIGLVVTMAAWVFLPGAETSEKPEVSGPREEHGLFSRMVLMLLLVLTLHAFVFHSVSAFLPLYLSREKEILLIYLGYYVAIPNLLGLLGRPLGGYLSDKIGRKRMTLVSFTCLAIGIVLTVVMSGAYWLLLSLALLGFGLHTVIPVLFAFLMDMFAPSKRALIAGRINTIRHVIAGLSPTVVGTIADTAGFSTAFLTLAFAVLVNFFVTLRMREERQTLTAFAPKP